MIQRSKAPLALGLLLFLLQASPSMAWRPIGAAVRAARHATATGHYRVAAAIRSNIHWRVTHRW